MDILFATDKLRDQCIDDRLALRAKDDGGLDWTRVTQIRVLGVEDYHG